MRIRTIILAASLLLLAGLPAFAQEEPRTMEEPQTQEEPVVQTPKKRTFNRDFALQDFRLDIGILASTDKGGMDATMLQMTYSRLFWNRFVWRAGAQYASDACGYQGMVGLPIGIGYRTGTLTFEEAVAFAVGEAVTDVVLDGLWGRPDEIGGDLLFDLMLMFFRRVEFFVGLTPAYYVGPASTAENIRTYRRFGLTGDVGAVLSIPIWRFTLNLTPTYHYNFIKNYSCDNIVDRNLFSFTVGVGYLF